MNFTHTWSVEDVFHSFTAGLCSKEARLSHRLRLIFSTRVRTYLRMFYSKVKRARQINRMLEVGKEGKTREKCEKLLGDSEPGLR